MLSKKRKRGQRRSPDANLVLGFSGWMDGGEVSTGAVDYLVEKTNAIVFDALEPEGFYVYSFPGSMEISALFRPHTAIEEGLIRRYEEPANEFFRSEETGLLLFNGKEPHFGWSRFADKILLLAEQYNVRRVCFLGSVAGLVPHTKTPRMFSCVSSEDLLPLLKEHGLHASNYEGPASFITYLTTRASAAGIDMMTLVAEIPAYVQGRNAKCLLAVIVKLAEILDLDLDLDDLTAASEAFEEQLDDLMEKRPDLAELVAKMEEDYDKEVKAVEMSELKEWFEKQNIRLN